MTCAAKHTKYQPTTEEFECPACAAKAGDFAIDEGPNMECEKLHDEDYINCYKCGYGTSGKKYATKIAKAKNMIPCPRCKGNGMIKGTSS